MTRKLQGDLGDLVVLVFQILRDPNILTLKHPNVLCNVPGVMQDF